MPLGLYITVPSLVVVITSRNGIPIECTDACKRRTAGTYKLGNILPLPECVLWGQFVVAPDAGNSRFEHSHPSVPHSLMQNSLRGARFTVPDATITFSGS